MALGTNDSSNGDGTTARLPFGSARFVTSYAQFVQLVKAKYPQVRIRTAEQSHDFGQEPRHPTNCLTAIKNKTDAAYPTAKLVAVYFFQPMTAHRCNGHPKVEDHAILTKGLAPFFENMIK